jgi:hypothetical protein
MLVARASLTTTALPFSSWPVTTRRMPFVAIDIFSRG